MSLPVAAANAVEVARVAAMGSKIAILRPTPWQTIRPIKCAPNQPPPFEQCSGPQSAVLYRDGLVQAAALTGYPLIDFTDLFCREGRCPAIIGNVFVYVDSHHITATYMRTLAPMLQERLGL